MTSTTRMTHSLLRKQESRLFFCRGDELTFHKQNVENMQDKGCGLGVFGYMKIGVSIQKLEKSCQLKDPVEEEQRFLCCFKSLAAPSADIKYI